MAWVKVPKENHPLFFAALPTDPRVKTINMFGAVAGLVNGNMFGGLFARSIMVKLSDADIAEAMKLDGTAPFDPMGNGHVMGNTVQLPDSVMDDPAELRAWLQKGFDYAVTLPAKKKGGGKKAKSAGKKPAAKQAAKKPAKLIAKQAAKKPAKKR